MLTEIRQDDKTVVQQHVCYYARRSCDADRDGKTTKLECSSMFVILHDKAVADRDGKMTKLECSSMFVILHDEARC